MKKKISRCALKLSPRSFEVLLCLSMRPPRFGAGGSVSGGSGSRFEPSCGAEGSSGIGERSATEGGLPGRVEGDASGRLAGRRPRERREASDAGRPAAYELMIFFKALGE